MPATEKKKRFRGIVQSSEKMIVIREITFKSKNVERGRYESVKHMRLTCGHYIDMRKLRTRKIPLRTHCEECEKSQGE